jgi:hypothetical protein
MGNFAFSPIGAHGNIATLSCELVVVPVMTKSMLSSTMGVNVCACPAIATRASTGITSPLKQVLMVFLSIFVSF